MFTGEQGASESANPITQSPLSTGQSCGGWLGDEGGVWSGAGRGHCLGRDLGCGVRSRDPRSAPSFAVVYHSLGGVSGLGFAVPAFHTAPCKSQPRWPRGHWVPNVLLYIALRAAHSDDLHKSCYLELSELEK